MGRRAFRETPRVAPAGAVALGTTLEALLRIREVRPFAALVPALDTAVPVERDRREILANMYLRHGFLASAAEEWLAVCETAPDAPALIGLAQLAVAQGDDENALSFAEPRWRPPLRRSALSCSSDGCASAPRPRRLTTTLRRNRSSRRGWRSNTAA